MMDGLPDPEPNAVDLIARKEAIRLVRETLDDIPERDRRILSAVFLDEQDKDEVCKDFGITRDNLRVVLMRAKLKLRARMRKNPPSPKGKAAD
jgi:RNA polymerase sigma-70 factor (ECF subfamily)